MKKTHKFKMFILFACVIGFVALEFGQAARVEANGNVDGTSEESTGDNVPTSDVVINIGDGKPTPESTYGKDVKIEIPLINEGVNDAFDVSIAPILDSSTEAFPYEIKQMSYEKKVGDLKGTESVKDN